MANPYHGPDGKFTSKKLAGQAYDEAIAVAMSNEDFEEMKRLRDEQQDMLAGKDTRKPDEVAHAAINDAISRAQWLTAEEKEEEHLTHISAATSLNTDVLESLRYKAKTIEVRNYITEKIYDIESETTDGFPYPTETFVSKLEGRTAEMVLEKLGLPAGVPVQIESALYYGGYSEYTQENSADFTVFAGGKTVAFNSEERYHSENFATEPSYHPPSSVYGRFQLWLTHHPTPDEFDRLFPNSTGSVEGGDFSATVDTTHPLWVGLSWLTRSGAESSGIITQLPRREGSDYLNFTYDAKSHGSTRNHITDRKIIKLRADEATTELLKNKFMHFYFTKLLDGGH